MSLSFLSDFVAEHLSNKGIYLKLVVMGHPIFLQSTPRSLASPAHSSDASSNVVTPLKHLVHSAALLFPIKLSHFDSPRVNPCLTNCLPVPADVVVPGAGKAYHCHNPISDLTPQSPNFLHWLQTRTDCPAPAARL